MSPYTSSVDTCRKRSIPAFFAASSNTTVPRTLVSKVSEESRTPRSTCDSAAKMYHRVGLTNQLGHQSRVVDVAPHKPVVHVGGQRCQVFEISGVCQQIEIGNGVVRMRRDALPNETRPNETSAGGDQDPHEGHVCCAPPSINWESRPRGSLAFTARSIRRATPRC